MTLAVRDAMAKTISVAEPRDTVAQIALMMRDEDTGCIPVCQAGHLVGIITDRDLVLRALLDRDRDPRERTAQQIMTADPWVISPDADLAVAGEKMDDHQIRRLPVVENGLLVGLLSFGNLVQATGDTGPGHRATLAVTRGA